MNESSIELVLSSVAIIVSTIAILVSWKTMSKTADWQRKDLSIRLETEKREKENVERQKLLPYINLVHKIQRDFDSLFSEYSDVANNTFSDIVDLADTYDNRDKNEEGQRSKALRHHMSDASYHIIEKNKKDILLQHPFILFRRTIWRDYGRIDYDLDLKNNSDLTSIEHNLKVLNESINSKEKFLYESEVLKRVKSVYKLYSDNEKKIEEAIQELEDAMIKYENYDFDNKRTTFYIEFESLINLLLYIKETSTSEMYEAPEGFDNRILSEILCEITNILIVNEGILKLSKY